MTLSSVPLPQPGPGQVLIRNHASSLNFFDILQIQGKYQVKPPFPFTPGAEVAGVIESAGAGVDSLKPGDRVLAFAMLGGYAEYTLAEAAKTFAIPEGMPFGEAAAMPIVYHTSYYALTLRGALRPGEWLLVHAGASGVGMSAIQLGVAFGAKVIATAGREEKLEFCRQQGAQHVLNYRDAGWVDAVKKLTGGGADVIYDPVGGEVFDLSTKCIAPHGRLLVIGFASGVIPNLPANRALIKDMSVVGVFWGSHANRDPHYSAQTQAALDALYRAGKIHPVVGREFPLDQAPAAMASLANRQIAGKAVLIP